MAHPVTLAHQCVEAVNALRRAGQRRQPWRVIVVASLALGTLAWAGRAAPARWVLRSRAAGAMPAATSTKIAAEPIRAPQTPPPAVEPAAQASAETNASGACPAGMLEVQGDYCPAVGQFCTKVLDQPERDRCAEFRPGSRCYGKTVPMHFCIDKYEYPNLAGATPDVAVTWEEAANRCEAEGKRLCKDTEWTLACEGEERLPYPYGNVRDAAACNIDKAYIMPDNEAFSEASTREAEIARLDQREASGSRASCVSPHGVHDMTGNVDEWVVNTSGTAKERPYVSGLKGGYWGPVRNRCRPMTVDHNQWHSGYQIGFRCCAGTQ